jgi:hypothetical protein
MVELPLPHSKVVFRVYPGSESFGYRTVPDGILHKGIYNGDYWISERLEGETLGRAKMYHTNQIQDWQYQP